MAKNKNKNIKKDKPSILDWDAILRQEPTLDSPTFKPDELASLEKRNYKRINRHH